METFNEVVKGYLYFRRVYLLNKLEYGKSLVAPKNFFDKLGIKITKISIKFKPISGEEMKNKVRKYSGKSSVRNASKKLEEEWLECHLLKSKFSYHYSIFYNPITKIQIEEIFYATSQWFDSYELLPGVKIVVKIPGEYLV
ncbi:MAG: hypothetical protein QXX07_02885 [Candidatus Aenigmatarchaeota archaeon]